MNGLPLLRGMVDGYIWHYRTSAAALLQKIWYLRKRDEIPYASKSDGHLPATLSIGRRRPQLLRDKHKVTAAQENAPSQTELERGSCRDGANACNRVVHA